MIRFKTCLLTMGVGLALAVSVPVHAAAITTTWTGAAGTDFSDASNWDNGAPANNDYGSIVRFTENAAANKTPNLTSGYSVNTVLFDDSVGWTISGSTLVMRVIDSSGSGTNTFDGKVKTAGYNTTWTIDAGNILDLAGGFVQDSHGNANIFHLTGGGTMIVAGTIGGWDSTVSTSLDNGLLVIGAAHPYDKGGVVHITSDDGILELKTDVAGAQGLIGSKIIDDTGHGLNVTDLGTGYVRIATAVPEPASAALLLLGVGGVLMLPRRRKVSSC